MRGRIEEAPISGIEMMSSSSQVSLQKPDFADVRDFTCVALPAAGFAFAAACWLYDQAAAEGGEIGCKIAFLC